MAKSMKLAPGTGGGFGLNVAGVRASGHINPVPYVVPWAVALAMAAFTLLLRFTLALAGLSLWYWSVPIGAVYLLVTFVTWRASRARGALTHWLATGGVAAASVWSWFVAGMDHLAFAPFFFYLLLAVAVCASANAAHALRGTGGESGGSSWLGNLSGALDKVRNVNEITVDGPVVRASYQMEPGVPARTLQASGEELASLLGIAPDAAQILPSGDNAAEGTLTLAATNPLKTSPIWTGPSIRQGGTAMDPMVLGVRRSGKPLQLWLPGDRSIGRNASMIMVMGMSGAGKSEGIRLLLLELLSRGTREEICYWYGNSRKGNQEPKWVQAGAERFGGDKKTVRQMLQDLYNVELPKRQAYLGERGYKEWEYGCGIPLMLAVFDEFADVAMDNERVLVDLAETLRSVGIIMLVGLQRASHSRMPTDASSNFGTRWCFGVEKTTDAAMGLPEEVLDAGAAPENWGNKKVGCSYLVAPGVDEAEWAEPARTFKPNDDLMEQWANYFIGLRTRGFTPSTVQAPAVSIPPRPTPAAATSGRSSDDDTFPADEDAMDDDSTFDLDEDDDLAAIGDEVDELIADLDAELGGEDPDDDPEIARLKAIPADLAEDLQDISLAEPMGPTPGGGNMRLGLTPKMAAGEARDFVRRFLADLHARKVQVVKKEGLGDLLAEIGYGASWLGKVLTEFCAEEPTWIRRTDDRGWYQLLAAPGPAPRLRQPAAASSARPS